MFLCVCETFEDGQPDVVDQYSEKLRSLGLDKFTVQKELTAMRALQSERAGVTGLISFKRSLYLGKPLQTCHDFSLKSVFEA